MSKSTTSSKGNNDSAMQDSIKPVKNHAEGADGYYRNISNEGSAASINFKMQPNSLSTERTSRTNYAQSDPYSSQLSPVECTEVLSGSKNGFCRDDQNLQQKISMLDRNLAPHLSGRNTYDGSALDQSQLEHWNTMNNCNAANQFLSNARASSVQRTSETTPTQLQQQAVAMLLSKHKGEDFAVNHSQANANQGQIPIQRQLPQVPENWSSSLSRSDLWRARLSQDQASNQSLTQQDGRPKQWEPQISSHDMWGSRVSNLAQIERRYHHLLAMQQNMCPSRLEDSNMRGPVLEPLFAAAHDQLPHNRGPFQSTINYRLPENAKPYMNLGRSSLAQLPLAQMMQTSNTSRSMAISTPHDPESLSELQCFLRAQIEYFSAGDEDVSSHTRGRNKNISLRQVGVRCIHCKRLPVTARGPGSVYFPSTIECIYQAGQNLHIYHIKKGCPTFSTELKEWYKQVTARKSYVGRGREYWTESARAVGLINTPNGIRFSDDTDVDQSATFNPQDNIMTRNFQSYMPSPACSTHLNDSFFSTSITSGGELVRPEDKHIATDYIFVLMSQLKPFFFHPQIELDIEMD
eukprot:CAMPEP_0194354812 /NCGR_PEP_ID=MMETSP0174-20130528/2838_1 /TAXON_ID=216777 /ORGANISM="Proboscia alata, Strain PI-D3" /LENGTH=576 /DNA_ID=CAMNT_0039123845 /DNA_START=54 /DNA_END=1785 /DNA_ORIENTATION=+